MKVGKKIIIGYTKLHQQVLRIAIAERKKMKKVFVIKFETVLSQSDFLKHKRHECS